MQTQSAKEKTFSSYQIFVIAILAILQFTVILDFMVLSPLGALLMDQLDMTTRQFGLVVSAYAFSAGISGLLAAGFADKYDRKKLLLFFYAGFLFGTFLCAIASTHHFLLVARVVTGLFGGVMSSISYAIITDLFKMEVRGRVMGFVQTAFAASQVLGIPVVLVLANYFGWNSPFWMIVGFGSIVGVLILFGMKPVTEHLQVQSEHNAFRHLAKTVSQSRHLIAFATTTLLTTGGFMLMPFSSAFAINNIGISMEKLPLLYGCTGVFSIVLGPLIGKLSDNIGKYKTFCIGSVITIIMVAIYNNLGITPLWIVIMISVCMFVGISSRMISATALMTAVPQPQDRGAFMSINSSVQQLSGGIASMIAGLIVVQTPSGALQRYDTLGYVVIGATIVVVGMMYLVNRMVNPQSKGQLV